MTITTQSFTAINVGTSANDGTGDDLRTAFIKVNDNFQYMGNTGFNAGNIYAPTGTVQAAYFIGDGSLLTNVAGGGGGSSNYSNVNVAAYLNTSGYNLYSNVNVASYLPSYTGVLTSSNVYVAGNVTARYILGSGQFLTGLPAGYSNVNVTAYTESMGFQNFSNVNVAAYLNNSGYNLYSNVNVAAYLNNNGAVPIGTTSTIYANATTQATSTGTGALVVKGGVGIAGNLVVGNLTVLGTQTTVSATSVAVANSFIFLSNNNITNAVDIGFVGQYAAGQGNVYTGLTYRAADGIYRLFSNLSPAPSLTVNLASAVYSNIQVGNVIAGNVIGVNFIGSGAYLTTLPGYAYSNVNVAAYVTSMGVTNFSNVNVKAYTETMGFQNYGNANVTAYTVTMGFTNFSNVNVAAVITTNGLTNYSNVNTAAYLNSQGYNLYSNVNVAAYLSSQGIGGGNYSNTNVIAYLNATGYNLYSNVNLIAYLAGNITAGNVSATYFTGNGSQLTGLPAGYSNVQVATYLPTYSGNITAGNITTTSNISASYLIGQHVGNASLTNLSATGIIYANAGTQSTSVGTGALVVTGGAGISGNLTVGNLTVLGTQTTVSAQSVNLSNSFVFLSNNNITNAVDIGFVGQYNAGLGNVYTGLAYRASDGIYRLFSNVSPQPSLTVNLASAIYSSLQVGNLNAVGNVLSTGLSVFGNTAHGLAGAVSGQFHSFVGNITQTSSGGAVYINTAGNLLVGGNVGLFGNTTHGTVGAVSGAYHTFVGNINQVTSGGTVYINTTGNLMVGGNTALAGNVTVGTVGAVSGAYHTIVGNITQVTSGGTQYFNTTGNISASFGNFGSGNVAGYAIGYRDLPQITAANLTLIATDAGKHYYATNTSPTTLTIPLNSSVPFATGTAVSVVNQGTGNITIAKGSTTLYLAGNSTSANRTITSYGMATLIKVATDTWFINGTGVS